MPKQNVTQFKPAKATPNPDEAQEAVLRSLIDRAHTRIEWAGDLTDTIGALFDAFTKLPVPDPEKLFEQYTEAEIHPAIAQIFAPAP